MGGALGGRRFSGPSGPKTRPTSERVREAVASALEARNAIEGAHVLELYAGTGALSFECLSRGATSALLVERDKRAIKDIQQSAKQLELAERTKVLALDLSADPKRVVARISAAARGSFDLIFADPPYQEADKLPALLLALTESPTAAGALIIFERPSRNEPPPQPGLVRLTSYRYGDTAIDLIRADDGRTAPP